MIKADIFMNPVRQRIIQYLLIHERGTVGEIHEKLHDIPTATLYRHIKILQDNNCLTILKETKVRGTVEKTYGLQKQPMGENISQEEISYLIQSSLLSLMTSFQNYFVRNDVDPMKDMISLSSSTLLLSEQEFQEMLQRIGEILNDYIKNEPNEDRKPRSITFISSPCDE